MNPKLIQAALLAACTVCASPSFAAGEADYYPTQFPARVSERSAAEVHAEALAAAQLKINDPSLRVMSRAQPALTSSLSREAVSAAAAKANREGLIPHGDLPF